MKWSQYSKSEVQSTPINRLLSLWRSTFTFSNHQGLFSKWSLVTWKSWLASQTEQLSPSRPGKSQSTWGMQQCVYTHARSPSSVHIHTHTCVHTYLHQSTRQSQWAHRIPPSHTAGLTISNESPFTRLPWWLTKNLPAMQEAWVWPLGWEDPLGEGNGNPLQ